MTCAAAILGRVRSYNVYALGFLAVLVLAWLVVVAAVVELVRWAT